MKHRLDTQSLVDSLRQSRWLGWLAARPVLPVLFAALYASAFLIPFPLLTWYQHPRASYGSITHESTLAALGLALAGLGLVMLYRRMWVVARDRPDRLTVITIVTGWLIASAMLLMTYPGQSTDMGDYTFRAHMLTHLDKNPMTVPPSDLVAHEDYPYIGWYESVDSYGPIWHGLAGGIHILAGENMLANFIAFKLLAILATGISGWLVYDLLRQISPAHAAQGLALWLWNPLVLNEGALHGHNDLVLITFVLAGFWLIQIEHKSLGIVALMYAGLVKANIWILLPVAAVWVWRQQGWRKACLTLTPAVVAGAVVIALTYMPYGGWPRLVQLVRERSWWPTNTWTAAIFFTLRDVYGWPHATVVRIVISGATLIFVLIAELALVKIRDLLTCAWAVTLAYLLIGCHWFQPWYGTWLIALTSIAVNRRLATYATIFTWFMLFHPIAAQYIAGQLYLVPGGRDLIRAATTLLVPQIIALRLIAHRKAMAP